LWFQQTHAICRIQSTSGKGHASSHRPFLSVYPGRFFDTQWQSVYAHIPFFANSGFQLSISDG